MNEQDYYTAWQQAVSASEPFDMAIQGGEIADNPGLIFIAGYQACIQATFPELDHKLWYSFAVSEDRSPESTRPGVTREGDLISGFKTWIAAVNHVDVLVLKVGSGEGAVYGTVSAKIPEVSLGAKPEPGFLPGMSQGQAEFRAATIELLKDPSGVANFSRMEPFFIYIAFLERLSTLDDSVAISAKTLLDEQRAEPDLVKLDNGVSEILELMQTEEIQLGANWDSDKRLFSMYSKGIQAQAAS